MKKTYIDLTISRVELLSDQVISPKPVYSFEPNDDSVPPVNVPPLERTLQMKKILSLISLVLAIVLFATACKDGKTSGTVPDGATSGTTPTSEPSTTLSTSTTTRKATPTPEPEHVYSASLLPAELESITVGPLSPDHPYYGDVTYVDPECLEYITEITIFDEEIGDTFVVHVSVPPGYSADKSYPMVVMTDGVWRLSDHVEVRPMMKEGRIEDLILVSIGYPDGYDYQNIRDRDLVNDPESFLHFIADNLMPYLLENYSVDETNLTLAGHSYGGYWAFYSLLHSDTICKNMFSNYVIASPALSARTGIASVDDYEELYYERQAALAARVYVTAGGEEPSPYVIQIDDFVAMLENRDYQGLDMTYEILSGYDHNGVFKPTLINALLMFYGKD